MSGGALQRLIGRATGAETPGLRPRLPARFEQGPPPPGFSEIAAELPASPAAPSLVAQMQRATPSMPPVATAREAAPQPVPTAPPPLLTPAAALPSVFTAAPPPERPLHPHPQAGPHISDRATQTRVPAPAISHDRPEIAAAETPRAAPMPPAALLPPDPAPQLPAGIALPRTDTPARTHASAPAATLQAEPEITIHIGRLDIRAPTPPPTPRRAPPSPALPGLSDYLRGGRK